MRQEDEKDNWLTRIHNATDELFRISAILENYAIAFEKVGNEKMFNKLAFFSERIRICQDEINKATGQSISLRMSREMSDAVLNAALAGCILGKESKDD